jgi:hypothetical protein
MFLKLNKVTGYHHDPYHDDDALESLPPEPEQTVPVTVNAQAIKSMYPRRNDRVGTRLNFIGGQGFAVKETKFEIDRLLVQAGAQLVGEHPSATITPIIQPESVN